MARPITVNTDQIVSAARDQFLENGYDETTTLAIAQRAGVSEGSLFKRFPGKAELFCAAMDLPPLELPSKLPALVGQGDLRDNLRDIALELIKFLEHVLPKAMMLWSQRRKPVPPPPGSPPLEILRALTDYFTSEMRLGRVRQGDPQILARLLQGACWSFCFLRLITEGSTQLPREEYADRLVNQLWSGMAPPAAVASTAPTPAASTARVARKKSTKSQSPQPIRARGRSRPNPRKGDRP